MYSGVLVSPGRRQQQEDLWGSLPSQPDLVGSLFLEGSCI